MYRGRRWSGAAGDLAVCRETGRAAEPPVRFFRQVGARRAVPPVARNQRPSATACHHHHVCGTVRSNAAGRTTRGVGGANSDALQARRPPAPRTHLVRFFGVGGYHRHTWLKLAGGTVQSNAAGAVIATPRCTWQAGLSPGHVPEAGRREGPEQRGRRCHHHTWLKLAGGKVRADPIRTGAGGARFVDRGSWRGSHRHTRLKLAGGNVQSNAAGAVIATPG